MTRHIAICGETVVNIHSFRHIIDINDFDRAVLVRFHIASSFRHIWFSYVTTIVHCVSALNSVTVKDIIMIVIVFKKIFDLFQLS